MNIRDFNITMESVHQEIQGAQRLAYLSLVLSLVAIALAVLSLMLGAGEQAEAPVEQAEAWVDIDGE